MDTRKIIDAITGEETVIPLTDEDVAEREEYINNVAHIEQMESLRRKRNRLLTETDWTQSRDVTLPNDAEWATYRQALRDLPANTIDPANPTWPTNPS
jgi:kynurenine formamidase